MNGPTLQVQMLGQFTLRYGDRTISDSDDRSRRVWSLLAYMRITTAARSHRRS